MIRNFQLSWILLVLTPLPSFGAFLTVDELFASQEWQDQYHQASTSEHVIERRNTRTTTNEQLWELIKKQVPGLPSSYSELTSKQKEELTCDFQFMDPYPYYISIRPGGVPPHNVCDESYEGDWVAFWEKYDQKYSTLELWTEVNPFATYHPTFPAVKSCKEFNSEIANFVRGYYTNHTKLCDIWISKEKFDRFEDGGWYKDCSHSLVEKTFNSLGVKVYWETKEHEWPLVGGNGYAVFNPHISHRLAIQNCRVRVVPTSPFVLPKKPKVETSSKKSMTSKSLASVPSYENEVLIPNTKITTTFTISSDQRTVEIQLGEVQIADGARIRTLSATSNAEIKAFVIERNQGKLSLSMNDLPVGQYKIEVTGNRAGAITQSIDLNIKR